jgi:hypothetical protein
MNMLFARIIDGRYDQVGEVSPRTHSLSPITAADTIVYKRVRISTPLQVIKHAKHLSAKCPELTSFQAARIRIALHERGENTRLIMMTSAARELAPQEKE